MVLANSVSNLVTVAKGGRNDSSRPQGGDASHGAESATGSVPGRARRAWVRRQVGWAHLYGIEQLELLEHVARLRSLGTPIGEAAGIGRELQGSAPVITDDRLEQLTRMAFSAVERGSRVAKDLLALRTQRARGEVSSAGTDPSVPHRAF
jgi:hypothetical protein